MAYHPWNKNQRSGKYVPCDSCGTIIYKLPCELKVHKHYFCSHECSSKFNEGKPCSDEVKRKIGDKNRGKMPWSKDKELVDIDYVQCVYMYQTVNLCIADIAKWWKCDSGVVYSRFKKWNVSIKNYKERLNTKKDKIRRNVDNDKILDLYTNQGYGAKEIAKIFNCDPSVIFNRLNYLGVILRTQKEAMNMERKIMKFRTSDRRGFKMPPRSKEHRDKLRQQGIDRWKNPEMRKKLLIGSRKGLEQARKYATSLEKEVIKIVPENVKFVGNGKFWIPIKNGKYKNRNPDFIVEPFSKTKKVIEVLGGYYHDPKFTKELWWDHEERIKNEYKSVGVNCFCIWYFDLSESLFKNVIIQKLEEFIDGS